jgi:3-methyladenine DNA glycosylase/8-oxoguanine DNA glycosylase
LKGIGDWTADVFLMMSLHQTDLFPTGDIALIKSIKEVKKLPADASKDDILTIANKWRPYRNNCSLPVMACLPGEKKNCRGLSHGRLMGL